MLNQPSFNCAVLFQFLEVPEHLMGSFQNRSVQPHGEFGASPDQPKEEMQKQHIVDSASSEFDASREDLRANFAYPVNVVSRIQVAAFDNSIAASSSVGSEISTPKSALNGSTTADENSSDGYAVGIDISEEKHGFLSAADQMQSQQDHWRRIFMNLRKGLKPREYAVRRVWHSTKFKTLLFTLFSISEALFCIRRSRHWSGRGAMANCKG